MLCYALLRDSGNKITLLHKKEEEKEKIGIKGKDNKVNPSRTFNFHSRGFADNPQVDETSPAMPLTLELKELKLLEEEEKMKNVVNFHEKRSKKGWQTEDVKGKSRKTLTGRLLCPNTKNSLINVNN